MATTAPEATQTDLAAENERLRAELAQARERERATAAVLRSISTEPGSLARTLAAVAEQAARVCGAENAYISLLEGEELVRAANYGDLYALPVGARLALAETPRAAAVLAERRPRHVQDARADGVVQTVPNLAQRFPDAPASFRGTVRTMLIAPLLRGEDAFGVIVIRRAEVRPFSDEQIAALESFADQAAIALENARLFQELQDSNATLKDALEQQTATSDVLQAIASSPADLAPVMETILERAIRLSAASNARILLYEGEQLTLASMRSRDTGRSGSLFDPSRLREYQNRGGAAGAPLGALRVAREGRTMHIPDMAALSTEDGCGGFDPEWVGWNLRPDQSVRTWLGIPLRRADRSVGVLVVIRRFETRAFTGAEIALLETFAAQAAIAIENTRLFKELQERDDRRRQELERAASIQQRLLPSSIEGWPGVLEIAHRFRPAVETSGDFYDVLRLSPAIEGALPPLQIAVGDVAGKGMAAALVTALARSALHTTVSVPTQMATPAGTLRVAGSRLHRDVGGAHFVACALAIVEPPGRHNTGPLLRLSNAAQVPLLLLRDGTACEIEPPGYRLPLGAQDDGAYRDVEIELRPGDAVVFSSDGLVEAPAHDQAQVASHLPPPAGPRELFGFPRLAASAAHWAAHAPTAEAVAEGVWSDLTSWCGEDPHHDDMTLLILRVP